MTTTPCVSLTTGTLSPDQRVNYAYGMVLGLDEFLQEQLYLLSKDRLHDRALHGFGTVSGLAVSVEPVDDDVQVTVGTGVGVDQWGRTFVVSCDQCARLGAWLATKERATPGSLAQHRGPSGEVTVYVVGSYAECLDNLVPLPGQPCSSSEQTMAASRTRDAWDVELTFDPPAMQRWNTDRRLARILASIVVVDDLPPEQSDEDEILAAVLDLADRADDGPDDLDVPPVGSLPQGSPWQLPSGEAADALDRILTAWVTRVRPVPALPVDAPPATSDAAILLSSITFVPADPFDPNSPSIGDCDDPDDAGRPYLLHTQLIQEIRSIGNTRVEQSPVELVTLEASSDSNGVTSIDAWFHLDEPVLLPQQILVVDEGGSSAEFDTSPKSPDANGFSTVWRLVSPEGGISDTDGLQISALFPASEVFVGDSSTTLPDIEASSPPFLGQDETGDVTAYAAVRAAVQPPPQTGGAPNAELVDIGTILVNADQVVLELWFHLEPRGVTDDVFAGRPALRVFDDVTQQQLPVLLTGPAPWSGNVWRIAIRSPFKEEGVRQYLRFQFDTKEFQVRIPVSGADDEQLRLADWIDKAGLVYEGWNPDASEIIVFEYAPPPADFKLTFPGLFEVHVDPHPHPGPIPGPNPLPVPVPGPHPFPIPVPGPGPVPVPVGELEPGAPQVSPAKRATAKATAAKAAPAKATPAKAAPAKATEPSAAAAKATAGEKAAAKKQGASKDAGRKRAAAPKREGDAP